MHDLNVIARLNAEATADAIPQLRAAGLWVVSLYSGLSYISHTSHTSAAEAQARVDAIALAANPGERSQLLEPIAPADPDAQPSGSTNSSGVDGEPLPASQTGLVGADLTGAGSLPQGADTPAAGIVGAPEGEASVNVSTDTGAATQVL